MRYITSVSKKIKRVYSSYVAPRIFNSCIILLYHRTANLKFDPQLLSVNINNFREQMKFIKENYNPIVLSELKDNLQKGIIPKKGAVVTFDDGYADNYFNAKPILKEFNIPATVFITTGSIGTRKEFWWDELERLLLLPETLPETLDLSINNKAYSWKLENPTNGKQFNPEKYLQWNVAMNETPTLRHYAYQELCNLLRPMNYSARQKVLDELAKWSRLDEKFRSDYLTMSADEICTLTAGGLIEVGGHTKTHPVLAQLPYQDQYKEIRECKMRLENILGRDVDTFSYPYGTRNSYTTESISAVKNAGFACACSNSEGKVNRETDQFQLPRFLVRNWDIETFKGKIKEFLYG